jgi:hypothetical protein
MQRCNVTVRLAGDVGNTVGKFGVSVAEIAILRAIHGADAVVDIKPTQNDKTPHRDERNRLSLIYGKGIVDKIFPGQFAKLPVTLKEIEPEKVDDDMELDPPPLSVGAERAVAAAKPEFRGEAEEADAEAEETEDA